MKIVLSPRAQRDLDGQIQYLIDQDAARPARAIKTRVTGFLRSTLAKHPRIGRPVEHRDLYETWIPGTRIVIWYRITPTAIEIARFWHTAQDRHNA
jgi:plasmid stabilization system protein ParE